MAARTMDDNTADAFVNRDDPIPVLTVSAAEESLSDTSSIGRHEQHKSKGLRSKLSSSKLHDKAGSSATAASQEKPEEHRAEPSKTLQDRLFARLLQQVIPSEDLDDYVDDKHNARSKKYINRPGFALSLMTRNFRRFNARIGVVFVFENKAIRLLSWRDPSHTVSFLAVYTFVCLDPSLLVILPFAVTLLFIMIPAFIARHPPPPTGSLTADRDVYSSHGPPIAPPASIKPVSEMSKDFIRNLRDLQNTMEDFSRIHDEIVKMVGPPTNFSNEALSSSLFLVLFALTCCLFIAAHLLPWRLLFLIAGWGATCLGHPSVQRVLLTSHAEIIRPRQDDVQDKVKAWIDDDIELDSAPEVREVEIFELQRRTGSGTTDATGDDEQHAEDAADEWESWMFSAGPYDPLSAERVGSHRPHGTRFFEDVQAPQGWAWSDKKWTLDLLSREWVEERMITGVEIETEGERWVYDLDLDRNSGYRPGSVDEPRTSLDGGPRYSSDNASLAVSDDDASSIYSLGVGTGATAAPPHRHRNKLHRKRKEKGHEKNQRSLGSAPSPWSSEFGAEDANVGRVSGGISRGEWRRRRWVRLVKRRSTVH